MKWDPENLAWYKDEDCNPEPKRLVKPFLARGNVDNDDEPMSEVELAPRRYADERAAEQKRNREIKRAVIKAILVAIFLWLLWGDYRYEGHSDYVLYLDAPNYAQPETPGD
jgi:hypothetical protein